MNFPEVVEDLARLGKGYYAIRRKDADMAKNRSFWLMLDDIRLVDGFGNPYEVSTFDVAAEDWEVRKC